MTFFSLATSRYSLLSIFGVRNSALKLSGTHTKVFTQGFPRETIQRLGASIRCHGYHWIEDVEVFAASVQDPLATPLSRLNQRDS